MLLRVIKNDLYLLVSMINVFVLELIIVLNLILAHSEEDNFFVDHLSDNIEVIKLALNSLVFQL